MTKVQQVEMDFLQAGAKDHSVAARIHSATRMILSARERAVEYVWMRWNPSAVSLLTRCCELKEIYRSFLETGTK